MRNKRPVKCQDFERHQDHLAGTHLLTEKEMVENAREEFGSKSYSKLMVSLGPGAPTGLRSFSEEIM